MGHLDVPFTTLISGNLQDVLDSICVQDVFEPFHRLFAYYSPMGGERSSSARQRLTGKICCFCKTPIDPDPAHVNGERLCPRCVQGRQPRKRVYMSFMHSKGWYCQFLEEDLKTSLPRKFTFATSDKVAELAQMGGGLTNLESKQALENGISMGRGGVFLNLTQEQYDKLRRS
jgi:hypothetical protein